MEKIDIKEVDLWWEKYVKYNLQTKELENVFANSEKIDSWIALWSESINNYVMENSNLKEDQFIIAQPGWDWLAHFYVSKWNKILDLWEFSYDTFIWIKHWRCPEYSYALKQFLDLCIKKISDPTIKVPKLYCNHNSWDMKYVYTEWYNN